jgi:DNA-binding SARP family transcriptional activator
MPRREEFPMTQKTTEFRVLGQMEVLVDDRQMRLGGQRLRSLLAALLVRPRQVLTPDQLIEDIWGTRARGTARASLHNLISSLRAILGSELLVTTNAGYALAVDCMHVDADRFETLLSEAMRSRTRDRARGLSDALALWRGSPFVDVRYESFAQPEIARLEELHVWALEEKLEAQLELGQADAVIAELTGLLVRFPFRERLRRLLIVALHRAGRPIDAVAVYVDWHRRLAADGLVPSNAMSQMRDALEAQAPGIASDILRLGRLSGSRRRHPRRELRLAADGPGLRRLGFALVALLCLRSSTARAPGSQPGDGGSTPPEGFEDLRPGPRVGGRGWADGTIPRRAAVW